MQTSILYSVVHHHSKITKFFWFGFQRKHREILLEDFTKKTESGLSQATLDFKKGMKYDRSDMRQIQITDSLVTFIAGDLMPLSVVDSKYFRNLMEKANSKYQMPSREYLSSY